MIIGGLQKTTLLDFPGRISTLVFTRGCNFYCPYCHNPDLISADLGFFSVQQVLALLKKRTNVLDGLVISGGEPCQHNDLPDFCHQVKGMGYAIKLDTNGSYPEILDLLLTTGLIDYVAMDIKADPGRYPKELCASSFSAGIEESIGLIRASKLDHEFRVTCVAPFVDVDMAAALGSSCGDSPVLFQRAKLDKVLNPGFFRSQGKALSDREIYEVMAVGLAQGLNWGLR